MANKMSITVELQGRTLEVKKLPLKKYAELLKQLKKLPQHLSNLEGVSNEEIFSMLPEIIADALPDFIGVIEVATELKADEIEELGMDEVVDVILAVFEVNKYAKIYNKLKKTMAQAKEENPQKK